MKHKRGDTLVEVALAVGIFSMVAIAVVSVVAGSASSAQGILEMTLAREEVNAQAEALRFIHTNYIAGDEYYTNVWNKITEGAMEANESVSEYALENCKEAYDNLATGAFVVNVRGVGNGDAVVRDGLKEATTYPRVVYGEEGLIGFSADTVSAAEGIYVIAVRDPGTTNIVGEDERASAYYDFYIRTCWYAAGATRPSTTSTVVRLRNPEALTWY